MNNPKEKLIEMEASVQQEKDKFGLYFGEMDSCLRSSSLLYARLFASSERIHVADRRSKTRLSKDREVS